MKVRVGFGYDVHALVPERDLWLGGVKIEHTMGLQGHSDADVLIHAICDALLGAANICLLYTSPSPRDLSTSRMPSSA